MRPSQDFLPLTQTGRVMLCAAASVFAALALVAWTPVRSEVSALTCAAVVR
jgi:hypothetical protein